MSMKIGRFKNILSLYQNGLAEEALIAVAKALRISPKDLNLLQLAGQIAETKGEKERAIMLYRRALAIKPDWAEVKFNLACALNSCGKTFEAIDLMQEVKTALPRLPQAREALAKFYQVKGDLVFAKNCWLEALTLYPERKDWRAQYFLLLRQMCDWSETVDDIENMPPQVALVFSDDPFLQRRSAEKYAKEKFSHIKSFPPSDWKKRKRLRIGYLSSDFHAHATAYLIAELFELHDKTNFEIFAYSYGVTEKSEIRNRIEKSTEHFVDVGNLTALKTAERIRKDEIDILVDLKGYTRGAKPEILAYRPARIQVHWLGYPATMGADFIDYFVGDWITLPEGAEKFFAEKLLRFNHCYQINDRKRKIEQPLPRSVYGIPEKTKVLASFNQSYKITPEVFGIWCEILQEFPQTVLWLFESNQYAVENLKKHAQHKGIDSSRLIFAKQMENSQHLARYKHVDIALDTFHVGGHTTTSDALWCGVPVVAIKGQSFVSRVAPSILTAAGLHGLIAESFEEYKEIVARLLKEEQELADIKNYLGAERQKLPLFDTCSFVTEWEKMLLEISSRHFSM